MGKKVKMGTVSKKMDRSKHLSAKKLYIELDESNYISINKTDDNISFYICQPQVCLQLHKDQILTLLSLKTVIEEMIKYLSETKLETLV